MNFIGIGPQELIVILVVALIFVGPQRLPKLAADLARIVRDVRRYTGGIAAEFNEAIKDFEKDTEPERTQWKEIGEGLGDASKSASTIAADVQADAEGKAPRPEAPAGQSASNGQPTSNGAAPEPATAAEDRP
jgi:sec-independent protein translocase protein TatB